MKTFQFAPKAVRDNEALVEAFVTKWIDALKTRFAATSQIFDFSDWGKYVSGLCMNISTDQLTQF